MDSEFFMPNENRSPGPMALGEPSEQERPSWSAKRLVAVLVAYVLGFLAASLFGALLNHGLETSARELLLFHLAYDCLFGLVVGGWWLLLLPAFYYFGFELLVSVLKHGGYGTPTFDRTEFALLGTLAIALGVGANALLHVLRRCLHAEGN